MTDKRQFQRVTLNVRGTLAHNDMVIDVVVSDVSLQGIKLFASETALTHLPFDSHEPYTAMFKQMKIALSLRFIFLSFTAMPIAEKKGCR